MKLNTVPPAGEITPEHAVPEDAKETISVDQRTRYAEIVDKYVMGEPIEKVVKIGKMEVILRSPSVNIINTIYRNVAKASNDSYVNMQVESSSSMLGAHVRSFNGHDFEEELKEEFLTVAGKQKVREYLDDVLIEPVRDLLTDKVFEFIDEVKKAFSDDSLDFS